MQKLQTQGVHHITFETAPTARPAWISGKVFWALPFVFEQPNLDDPDQTHLYFDPGDGRSDHDLLRPKTALPPADPRPTILAMSIISPLPSASRCIRNWPPYWTRAGSPIPAKRIAVS